MRVVLEKTLIKNGTEILKGSQTGAKEGTISYGILKAHNIGADMKKLKIRFDALVSHDITYVGIIQTPGPAD